MPFLLGFGLANYSSIRICMSLVLAIPEPPIHFAHWVWKPELWFFFLIYLKEHLPFYCPPFSIFTAFLSWFLDFLLCLDTRFRFSIIFMEEKRSRLLRVFYWDIVHFSYFFYFSFSFLSFICLVWLVYQALWQRWSHLLVLLFFQPFSYRIGSLF